MTLHHGGFPIRKSTDQCLFTAPRSLSQLVTSFFGSRCQGILLMLFFAWTSSFTYLYANCAFLSQIIFFGCLFVFNFFRLLAKNVVSLPTFSERPFSLVLISKLLFQLLTLVNNRSFLNYLFRFRSLFGFQWTILLLWALPLVETKGIEPSTSWMPFKRSPRWATPPLECFFRDWSLKIEQRFDLSLDLRF